MGHPLDERLRAVLAERQAAGSLRYLRLPGDQVDFSSNDYLGLATQAKLPGFDTAAATARQGAGGSRLLTGNHPATEALENRAAAFHGAEAALFFPTGYHANAGLLATLIRPGDAICYDRLIHASLHEGIKLSGASARPFAHNDLEALEVSWPSAEGQVFVVVESVYSMDGDLAPLNELAALCLRKGGLLLVDEAHGAGLLGPAGRGLVNSIEAAQQEAVYARVVTYGKAFGAAGGMVLGSASLREYLINYCKPFIYSTGPLPAQVAAVAGAYDAVQAADAQREQVHSLRKHLLAGLADTPWMPPRADALGAAVVPLHAGSNAAALALAKHLWEAGFDLRPIRYPTVPRGQERLRCCLHAFNTTQQLDGLLRALADFSGPINPPQT